MTAPPDRIIAKRYPNSIVGASANVTPLEGYSEYLLRDGPTMQAAIAAAEARGREQGLREAARVGFVECAQTRHVTLGQKVANAILAGLPPRRASGPLDPEQGFATTGAEARWIADADAGVYDNAPCPTCGRELLLSKSGHVYCRECPAPLADGGDT